MRLIDAHALEKALEATPIRIATEKGKMYSLIENAPTVEAAPKEELEKAIKNCKALHRKLCDNCIERYAPVDQASCWGCRDGCFFNPISR